MNITISNRSRPSTKLARMAQDALIWWRRHVARQKGPPWPPAGYRLRPGDWVRVQQDGHEIRGRVLNAITLEITNVITVPLRPQRVAGTVMPKDAGTLATGSLPSTLEEVMR